MNKTDEDQQEFIDRIVSGDLDALSHNLDLCIKEQADELTQAYAAGNYDLDAKCDREVYCAMAERSLAEANIRITELEAQLANEHERWKAAVDEGKRLEAQLAASFQNVTLSIETTNEAMERAVKAEAEAAEARAEEEVAGAAAWKYEWERDQAREDAARLRNVLQDVRGLIADGRLRTANEAIQAALTPESAESKVKK